jgi:predicted  nucleic acid-binding Zn-ribbon protein
MSKPMQKAFDELYKVVTQQSASIQEVVSDNSDMRRELDKVFDYLQKIDMNLEDIRSKMVDMREQNIEILEDRSRLREKEVNLDVVMKNFKDGQESIQRKLNNVVSTYKHQNENRAKRLVGVETTVDRLAKEFVLLKDKY